MLSEKVAGLVDYLLKYISSEQGYLQQEKNSTALTTPTEHTEYEGTEDTEIATIADTKRYKVETSLNLSMQAASIKVLVQAGM